jgi:hypothetical protein
MGGRETDADHEAVEFDADLNGDHEVVFSAEVADVPKV